jgi:hypothetical protein
MSAQVRVTQLQASARFIAKNDRGMIVMKAQQVRSKIQL